MLLGARNVTAVIVGSGALFGHFLPVELKTQTDEQACDGSENYRDDIGYPSRKDIELIVREGFDFAARAK